MFCQGAVDLLVFADGLLSPFQVYSLYESMMHYLLNVDAIFLCTKYFPIVCDESGYSKRIASYQDYTWY